MSGMPPLEKKQGGNETTKPFVVQAPHCYSIPPSRVVIKMQTFTASGSRGTLDRCFGCQLLGGGVGGFRAKATRCEVVLVRFRILFLLI